MPGAASIITWCQEAHARQARRCIGSWTSSLAIVSGMDLGRSGRARWRAAHKMPRLAPNTSLIVAVSSRGSCLKREQTQEPGPRSLSATRARRNTQTRRLNHGVVDAHTVLPSTASCHAHQRRRGFCQLHAPNVLGAVSDKLRSHSPRAL